MAIVVVLLVERSLFELFSALVIAVKRGQAPRSQLCTANACILDFGPGLAWDCFHKVDVEALIGKSNLVLW